MLKKNILAVLAMTHCPAIKRNTASHQLNLFVWMDRKVFEKRGNGSQFTKTYTYKSNSKKPTKAFPSQTLMYGDG